MKGKVPIIIAVIGLIATVFLIRAVIHGGSDTKPSSVKVISVEEAEKKLEKTLKNVKIRTAEKVRSTVDYSGDVISTLPDIETKYPLTVTGDGDIDI